MSVLRYFQTSLIRQHQAPQASSAPAPRWTPARYALVLLSGVLGAAIPGAWWMYQRHGRIALGLVALPLAAVATPPVTAPAPAVRVAQTPAALAAPALATVAPVPTATATDAAATRSDLPTPAARSQASTAHSATTKVYTPRQVAANLLAESLTLEQQGRREEAKAPLRTALASNPFDLSARQTLVRLHADTGRVADAQALLTEGRRLHPDQPGLLVAQARLAVDAGDAEGALTMLSSAPAIVRDSAPVNGFIGGLLVQRERYAEALPHYVAALRVEPTNPTWLIGTGMVLERTGRNADAQEIYRRVGGTADLAPEMRTFLAERLSQVP